MFQMICLHIQVLCIMKCYWKIYTCTERNSKAQYIFSHFYIYPLLAPVLSRCKVRRKVKADLYSFQATWKHNTVLSILSPGIVITTLKKKKEVCVPYERMATALTPQQRPRCQTFAVAEQRRAVFFYCAWCCCATMYVSCAITAECSTTQLSTLGYSIKFQHFLL